METLPPFLVAAAASCSQKPLLRRLHRAQSRRGWCLVWSQQDLSASGIILVP
ncbi:hypothetical protein SLEP1_g52041 [Rubroshorea leprosula]|uniref:Uncharacterized protein n=1 Tax=Rubroshorea leprosula TaxID=152421 RepID=A0AAV5M7Q7_9ROSI|nr:hypothetical protein SLEP1_g52041 [Rubroshorea leprosula]